MDTATTTLDIDSEHIVTEHKSIATDGIDTNNDKKLLSQKSFKKKRKYTPRKKKNKTVEKPDKQHNNLESIDHLTSKCNDMTNNDNLGNNFAEPNKFWNPFQIPLFLSILKYRRLFCQMGLPVSLF